MQVLVTGGAGHLGINVCKEFLNSGYQVRVFDLDTPRNRESVKALESKAEILWGDITKSDSVKKALNKVDAVVHMAGILPPLADEKPELCTKVNVGGTQILVDLIKEKGGHIPFVFTSSVAVFGPTPNVEEPISADKHIPNPKDTYGQTKLRAENLIKESGIDYLILRLTAVMYFDFEVSDLKRMFCMPLDTRVEFCHPDDLAVAVLNAVKYFDAVKGNTLVVSGGPDQRMSYRDMVGKIIGIMGLPLPPAEKFTKEPYYLDWYDTSKSQELLKYQQKTFTDYLGDYARGLTRRYSTLFLPFMRYFVSPVFGKLVVQFIRA
ncbi:MAG TPA: NAD(P)-dependent oxidoreductase [Dehalococcoidia bacterium]|nr:NAD(P)-dependent oxidoreductase [Dehalococcoidia bacterium]